jgi:cytochrome P450
MVSSTSCFFLAMTLYPDIMKKAQAELDAVVGPYRLPTFADGENLPYLDAVLKEVFRWAPVTPFGASGFRITAPNDVTRSHRRSSSCDPG